MLRSAMAADWIEQRGWVAPDYAGGNCFASLPGTVTQLLTGSADGATLPAATLGGLDDRYDRVVFVYFDAFSYEMAERHAHHPLLERAAAGGVLRPITSQFPSTTTGHMTTIHTGVPVGEHGLYEWFVLEPRLDRLIAPLPFGYAGEGQGPLPEDFTADALYPSPTIYEQLAERGVSSVVAGPWGVAVSPTSAALTRGASGELGYGNVAGGLAELARAVTAMPPPAYGFIYIETIDTLMHKVGPGEPVRTHVDTEVARLLEAIEHELLDALPAGTLVLVTSDHGMTPVSPADTIYLNAGEQGAEIASLLRSGAEPSGHPLAPAGSCRDLFLHAAPDRVDDLVTALQRLLGERAEVRRAGELIDAGLFGPNPSAKLRARLGDVAVLPQLGDAVYWYTPGRFLQTLWGQHGGLTPSEMLIPLIALRAG
jgi:hypothetical protein